MSRSWILYQGTYEVYSHYILEENNVDYKEEHFELGLGDKTIISN